MATLKITQVKSTNGANPKQRDTLRSLGLGKIGRTTEREDGDVLRGMVAKVAHMVKVDG
ncbi:MAG: 50S ribosomal protein L30 [Thermoleophilaceae bacterium]|jgi:large subunit ribosomal protein L30